MRSRYHGQENVNMVQRKIKRNAEMLSTATPKSEFKDDQYLSTSETIACPPTRGLDVGPELVFLSSLLLKDDEICKLCSAR